jgi:hypothetical protein
MIRIALVIAALGLAGCAPLHEARPAAERTPQDAMVGWRVEIEPGLRYTYGTIRDGDWRHHLEFDLTSPVPAPPPPWGHETRPSQRP